MSLIPASSPDDAFGLSSPVEALRRRIRIALAGSRPASRGDTLLAALRHAMAALGAKNLPGQEDLFARFGQQPSLESLARFATEHGLILDMHGAASSGFPYVALLKDGTAIAVIGRHRNGDLVCQWPAGPRTLSAGKLRQAATGERIYVRQASGRATSIETARHPALPNVFRIARLVGEAPKARLAQLLVAALLSNLLLVVLPLFTTTVYDRVVPYGAFETLTALCVGVVIVFAIDIGLRMARVNLQEAVGVAISLDLQAAFYRKLVRAPLALTGGASGVTSMLYDIDGAALTAPSLIVGLLADLPFVVVMLLLVGYLGGAVVLAPLLGVFIVGIITGTGSARARKATGISHRLRVRVQDQAIETAAMLPMVKALHAEAQLIDRWHGATDASAFAAHTARQASAWSSQISLVSTQIVIAFTVVLGAIEINAGAMTLGNLAACVMLVGRIIAPANLVVAGLGQLANMRQSIGGFFAVIDRVEESGGDEQAPTSRTLKGRIDLHAVSFAYPAVVTRSLDNVSLSIREGERVGIIGRNGCGKSTLLKLLPRLYDPELGTILIDGADSRQLSPQQLRSAIGFMAQETVLINDTLRANICLGFDTVNPAAFERAAQLSGVAEFARLNALGYNIPVGPRGEALSGGERQAVALARAILGNPRILLLDEPTAAMDNTAESRLIRELPAFFAGRTVILATHRLQLLGLVDRIIWMDRGRIVADGPKADVMATLQRAT